jgi:hypothetical protein
MHHSKRPIARASAVVAAVLALLLAVAGPAWANTVTISGSMEGAAKPSPGDWISAGYSFTMPGNHPAATVSYVNAQVVVHWRCDTNHTITGDITIPLSGGPYSVGQNDSSWFPANSQQVAAVYQGAVQAPDVCSGGLLDLSAGATFTADVQSTDTSDNVNTKFHYNDAALKGSHVNLNCSSTTDNPNPNGVSACSASWSGTTSVVPDPVTGVALADWRVAGGAAAGVLVIGFALVQRKRRGFAARAGNVGPR